MDISEEALAHAAEDYNMWVPILNACRALGREDHARILLQRELQVFTKQVEKVPEDARARMLLAGDYARLGRVEEAGRELRLALSLRPDDGVLLYNAACVLCLLGLKGEAMKALKDALNAGFRPIPDGPAKIATLRFSMVTRSSRRCFRWMSTRRTDRSHCSDRSTRTRAIERNDDEEEGDRRTAAGLLRMGCRRERGAACSYHL